MTRDAALPVWRSMLFVPVNVDRFVDKAHTRGADAIQLDLEDSVPPPEKEAARRLVQGAAERVARGGSDVLVRINRPWREALKDLEASVSPRVHGLALPKIESADHVRMIAEVAGELERERGMAVGSTKLVAMIETAGAFFRMEEIARADPRVVGLTLGSEDFALSVGMLPEADGQGPRGRDRGVRDGRPDGRHPHRRARARPARPRRGDPGAGAPCRVRPVGGGVRAPEARRRYAQIRDARR